MVQVKSIGHYKVLSGKIKQHQGQGGVGGLLFRVGKGDVILSFFVCLFVCLFYVLLFFAFQNHAMVGVGRQGSLT